MSLPNQRSIMDNFASHFLPEARQSAPPETGDSIYSAPLRQVHRAPQRSVAKGMQKHHPMNRHLNPGRKY
jgi:hypothetical protein